MPWCELACSICHAALWLQTHAYMNTAGSNLRATPVSKASAQSLGKCILLLSNHTSDCFCCASPQVRLNFLSSLLHEAYDHLHQHLTASVLGVKLLLLPFHRDVSLTPAAARAMRAAVSHCQRVCFCCVVPDTVSLCCCTSWTVLCLGGTFTHLHCMAFNHCAACSTSHA
jgi:hypothetical protein